MLGDGPYLLERSDQRLGVLTQEKGWVAYYPDVAVYCADARHPLDADTRIDPKLLIEVTSKTTEKKDRGLKLEDYLQIAALDEYVIASHARRELEVWTRGESGWTRRLATEGVVALVCGATIDVSRLYDSLPD